mmetsp:Transcript_94909/g.131896  ORF Transcript_94909/g.131896 Transcript_94909/m.131896 type:complete len:256 (-) Transcript_94909:480-1247(-)
MMIIANSSQKLPCPYKSIPPSSSKSSFRRVISCEFAGMRGALFQVRDVSVLIGIITTSIILFSRLASHHSAETTLFVGTIIVIFNLFTTFLHLFENGVLVKTGGAARVLERAGLALLLGFHKQVLLVGGETRKRSFLRLLTTLIRALQTVIQQKGVVVGTRSKSVDLSLHFGFAKIQIQRILLLISVTSLASTTRRLGGILNHMLAGLIRNGESLLRGQGSVVDLGDVRVTQGLLAFKSLVLVEFTELIAKINTL